MYSSKERRGVILMIKQKVLFGVRGEILNCFLVIKLMNST